MKSGSSWCHILSELLLGETVINSVLDQQPGNLPEWIVLLVQRAVLGVSCGTYLTGFLGHAADWNNRRGHGRQRRADLSRNRVMLARGLYERLAL